MKTKNFKLEKCWVIEGWQTEMRTGMGAKISYRDGCCIYEGVMFFPDNKKSDCEFEIISNYKAYFDNEKALKALNKEREDYKSYLIKTAKESQEKLKEIFSL